MKFTALALCAAFMSVATATAGTISFDEARAIAASSTSLHKTSSRNGDSPVELAYVMKGEASGNPTMYVFNRGNGFVIVSADDNTKSIVGYSDEGNFDITDLDGGLGYWMQTVSNGIEAIAAGVTIPHDSRQARATANRSAVAPMLRTKWGQGEPYNTLCPANSAGTHAKVGCVPLAMAQIVRYFKFAQPNETELAKGFWFKSLSGSYLKVSGISEEDFAFDFSSMPASLEEASGDDEINAVAKLALKCGYLARVSYGTNSTEATENNLTFAFRALGYDPGMRIVMRDCYSCSEWDNMIYNELAGNRPVLYMGASSSGSGHAFVCDGYDGNGLYHINWGWDGKYNGYFDLDFLSTINGVNNMTNVSNYSAKAVKALIGIQPNQDNMPGFTVYGTGSMNASANGSKINIFDETGAKAASGYVKGTSYKYGEVISLFAKFVNRANGTTSYLPVENGDLKLFATSICSPGDDSYSNGVWTRYYSNLQVSVDSLPKGSYDMSLAYKKVGTTANSDCEEVIPCGSDEMCDIVFADRCNSVRIDIDEFGKAITQNKYAAPTLSVSDVHVASTFMVGVNNLVTMKVTNTGNTDFYGNIVVDAVRADSYDKGNMTASQLKSANYSYCLNTCRVCLCPGEEKEISVGLSSYGSDGARNNAYLCVFDETYEHELYKSEPFKAEAKPSNDAMADLEIRTDNIEFDEELGRIDITLTLTNSSTEVPFIGSVYTYLAISDGETYIPIEEVSNTYVMVDKATYDGNATADSDSAAACEGSTITIHTFGFVSTDNIEDYEIVTFASTKVNENINNIDPNLVIAFNTFSESKKEQQEVQTANETEEKGVTTGIESVEQDGASESFTDLGGRAVNAFNLPAGLYIRTVRRADGTTENSLVKF